MFHESPAVTADMDVLPGVLGCRTLRRTVQVRLRSKHPVVARWHAHLHGLATAIHETSGLVGLDKRRKHVVGVGAIPVARFCSLTNKTWHVSQVA